MTGKNGKNTAERVVKLLLNGCTLGFHSGRFSVYSQAKMSQRDEKILTTVQRGLKTSVTVGAVGNSKIDAILTVSFLRFHLS